jgi:hypothetical protein
MKAKAGRSLARAILIMTTSALAAVVSIPAAHAFTPFIDDFTIVTQGTGSAPAAGFEAGDLNPYGVAVVPQSIGALHRNNILVSNFNAVSNLQGTGSSIVQYSPDVQSQTTFAEINANKLPGRCPGGVGLTTALVVLRSGWVIVGSLPTSDGMIDTVGAGCLIVLDAKGNPVETFSGPNINGPWDMTAVDEGSLTTLYFTNVLNGDVAGAEPDSPVYAGTVVRMTLFTPPQGFLRPRILATRVVGSGFAEENDPNALIIGPTGVAVGRNDTLYVADTVKSRIAKISNASTRFFSAGTGQTVSAGDLLNQPLGLALAPNGDILTVNAGDGNIVETTVGGTQFTTATAIGPNGGGSLFGLAVVPGNTGIYFVDDSENQLNLFH